MSRVLITPRSLTGGELHTELRRLRAEGHELVFSTPGRLPTATELRSLVPSCHAWLAGVETIDRSVLEKATDMVVIARYGIGLDSIDLEAAKSHGITVVPSYGSNAEGVAELVILLALTARRPRQTEASIDDPIAWKRRQGTELQNRHAGVIGHGAVGSRVADLLTAFEMQIRVFDPFVEVPLDREPASTVMEAIQDADLVTLHCPPGEVPVIATSELAALAPGATLVNTARGPLVDLDAALLALESGQLGAYACDVYATEPPEPHPIWAHPNVLTTPHLGGFTVESGRRAASLAVDNILERLQ